MTDETIEFERSREAQGWARWIARLMDNLLLTPAVYLFFMGVGIAIELGQLPADLLSWFNSPFLAAVLELAVQFLVLCLWEPLFLSNTGTTPGKWIMGIRVRTANDTRLGFFASLWRFIRVWFVGMGSAIPLVSLITMLYARAKLISDGVTVWDEQSGHRVLHRKRHPIVWVLAIVFGLGLNIAIVVFSRMLEQDLI